MPETRMPNKISIEKSSEALLKRHLRYQPQIEEVLCKYVNPDSSYDHIVDPKKKKKAKKTDQNRRTGFKRMNMEWVIRNAQEDLLNNILPPIEYTKLLTHLLCSYLDEINELGSDSKPALLSKHLYLSGSRTGADPFYYLAIAQAFKKGFLAFKDKPTNETAKTSQEAIAARAMNVKKGYKTLTNAYFEEGKILALSGSKIIQRKDLTNVISAYQHLSTSGADKVYDNHDLNRFIHSK